jgi:hypothetical protein
VACPRHRTYLQRGFLLAVGAYLAVAAAFCNRQRFFVAAMIRFKPSGLLRRFALGAFTLACRGSDSAPSFAHLALCAIAILRRAAALIFRPFRCIGSDAAPA